jgi:hypothetical protein
VRFERLGRYVYRFLADGELLGFTVVDVVSLSRGDRQLARVARVQTRSIERRRRTGVGAPLAR